MRTSNKDKIISEKKFEEILNNLDVGFYKGEFKGKLLMHNLAINNILGLDPSQSLIGKSSSQFFTTPEERRNYIDELERNGRLKDFITKLRKPNGDIIYVQINAHLEKEDDNTPLKVEGTVIDITEKYFLEQELKDSEEKYKLILENANDLISIFNEKFKVDYINENAHYNILGYSKDFFLKTNPFSLLHPDDTKKIIESFQTGFIQGESSGEYRFKHKNGNYVWLESRGKTFLNKHGKKRAILISRDISEKKKVEQELREYERKFKLISENTNDLLAILNINFEHIFINENAYYSVLGYRKEEVLGKRPRDFAHPDDINRVSKSMKRGLFKGELSEEFRTRHKNGLYKWIELKGKFLKENNEIIGAILISRDITERKNGLQKIEESENKYRTLFESSTDGIYSTDMEGLFIEVNEAFVKMLGYSREDLLKMHNRQVTPKKCHKIEDNMLFTHLSAGESKVYEKEYIQKNGNILPVSIRFWILQDEQGDPHRIWAIVRDITEIKQMEQKLKEVNRIKSEFLRRASHELKTPLISIKGFADLILTLYSEELMPDIISNLEEIDKGCERLQYIINNLLHTSKLESPNLKPKLEKEDLSFLINYCVAELHALAVKREHSFNIEIHDSIITRFEKEEIHDVISNLLMNAIKYTPPRGWIDIKTEIKDDFIIVSIKDNGIGFTEEEKEKIFKQFGKIERYGQGLDLGIDGTGLGLYISKKIVESHDGKIWMESKGKNKGSIFYFSLPLIKD